MKTKKRMRYLALFIASVVAFTMLPTNVLEVKAGSDICTCGHFYDDHASGDHKCMVTGCSCTGFSPSSSSSSTPSTPTTPSTSSVVITDDNSSDDSKETPEEMYARKQAELDQQLRERYRENSTISSGGTYLKTTIDGAYTAQSVAGTVITTPKEQLMESFALKEGQSLRVETWDVTKGNSPDAMRSLEAGAKSIGGELGPAIQVNIKKTKPQVSGALKALVKALLNDKEGIGGVWSDNLAVDPDALAAYLQDKPGEQEFLAKFNNVLKEARADPNWANASKAERMGILDQYFANNGFGRWSDADGHLYEIRVAAQALAQQNSQGTAEMTVGLPENLRDGSSISVVKVTDGGNIQVLQDKDNNSNTVSFVVTEGEAAYALVKTNPIARDIVENLTFLRNDQKDALAAYLADKPDELSFIVRFSNAYKETLNYYSEHKGLDEDQKDEVADRFYEKYGLGSEMDAIEHLNELRKAAKCKQ
ncbi:MAG: hemophore-related protein [Lachnospiraceae bacterium]|nr:hemophore-related protein [Lachnospiraceae bacterium]